MSFYNMMNGVSPLTFLVLPMLGKHPEEIPRFRNLFLKDAEHPKYDNMIHVYTRVGGGNRNCGYNEEELMKHPNFITTFDDSCDNTYATYVFSVPEEWRADFDVLLSGNMRGFSAAYKAQLIKVFPKLEEEFNKIINNK